MTGRAATAPRSSPPQAQHSRPWAAGRDRCPPTLWRRPEAEWFGRQNQTRRGLHWARWGGGLHIWGVFSGVSFFFNFSKLQLRHWHHRSFTASISPPVSAPHTPRMHLTNRASARDPSIDTVCHCVILMQCGCAGTWQFSRIPEVSFKKYLAAYSEGCPKFSWAGVNPI